MKFASKKSALLGSYVSASVLKMLAKEPGREARCCEELSINRVTKHKFMILFSYKATITVELVVGPNWPQMHGSF